MEYKIILRYGVSIEYSRNEGGSMDTYYRYGLKRNLTDNEYLYLDELRKKDEDIESVKNLPISFPSPDDIAEKLEDDDWCGVDVYEVAVESITCLDSKKSAPKKSVKLERLEKKLKELNGKKDLMEKAMSDYVTKNNVKNRKTVYVGCACCGSKINKNYIPLQMYSQNCPMCHTDLFSDTVKARIKKYREDIADFEKQVAKINKDIEIERKR